MLGWRALRGSPLHHDANAGPVLAPAEEVRQILPNAAGSNSADASLVQFFATLAQITAAALALLAAGVIAYIVFLNDRRTQFDDQVQQHRFEIRQALLDLRGGWANVRTISLLPGDFDERYRAAYPDKVGADLINQALTDLVFRKEPMERALRAVESNAFPQGPMRGRAYVWALYEAIALLTRIDTPAVFPFEPRPGYTEWKRDFDALRSSFHIAQFGRAELLVDFQAATSPLPEWQRSAIQRQVSGAVVLLDQRLETIRKNLDSIGRAEVVSARYRPNRPDQVRWIVGLCFVTFIGGLVFPLLVLASGRWRTRKWAIVAVASLVPLVWACGLFLQQLADVPTLVETPYASQRWFALLLGDLKQHAASLESKSRLEEPGHFQEALQSVEAAEFPALVRSHLKEYLAVLEQYNTAHRTLTDAVVQQLEHDRYLESLSSSRASGPEGGVGLAVSVLRLLNARAAASVVDRVANEPERTLSVEASIAQGSRVISGIPGIVVRSRKTELLSYFERLQREFCGTLPAERFDAATRSVEPRLSALAKDLDPMFERPKSELNTSICVSGSH